MFKNYLKIAFRNLKRYKGYSLINIAGLALGMACFLLIMLYVRFELSYDMFHENRDRIYQILNKYETEDGIRWHGYSPAPLGPALVNDFPEIIEAARLSGSGGIVTYKDKSFIERSILLVDPSFFEMFTFPLVKGNPKTVFSDKNSIVITEEMAEKYFGNEDPRGKVVTLNQKFDFQITGVAENPPRNSDIRFDFLVPFVLINDFSGGYDYLNAWNASNFPTYVIVSENFDVYEFGEKTVAFFQKYAGEAAPDHPSFSFLSLTKKHLDSEIGTYDIQYIYLFSSIAFIIMILACINFMNLALAQSANRVKEIGIRKTVGASRGQLIRQFMGEAVFLSLFVLPITAVIIKVFLRSFITLTNTSLRIDVLRDWPMLLAFLGIALLAGLISGSYPAVYSSATDPVSSLRGNLAKGTKRSRFRNILVVFQFSASIVLIIGTIIVRHQLTYLKKKDLGLNKNHVINVTITDRELRKNYESLKSEFLKNPRILSATATSFSPGSSGNNSVWWEGRGEDEELQMRNIAVDPDFMRTLQIELVEGRGFFPSDRRKAYILNESAVKALGWESAVGKQFAMERVGFERGPVVGVVTDFHFNPVQYKITPLVLYFEPGDFFLISLRVLQDHIPDVIGFLKNKIKELAPGAPFEYSFLDQRYERFYRDEERLGKIFHSFSFLAILIACLGLLGLTSYSIVRRTKEIGIRKVLGASVLSIMFLLTREFIKWVIIANIIAWPVARFVMDRWLENFAYRVTFGIWIFFLAGFIALAMAIINVSYQTVRASLANPADSLRYE
jgi:putative ABC transport system permease protein